MNALFPQKPWDTIPAAIRGDWENSVERLTDALLQKLGGPRRIEPACRFMVDSLPAGRIFLYPGGVDSEKLIQVLQARRPDVEILGVADRQGVDYGRLRGFEVIKPEALPARAFDRVVITNPRREGLLHDTLRAVGLDETRVFNPYSHPDYLVWCKERLDSLAAPALAQVPADIRNVIIAFHPTNVMNDGELARAFPPRETLLLYMGFPELDNVSNSFRSITFGASLLILERLLQAIRPETVLVSSFHVEAYMTLPVKRFCPDAQLIHQIYDPSLLFPKAVIAPLHNTSVALIEAAHVGELFSARHYDTVVTKRSGPCWARFLEEYDADYLQYFQGAHRPETEATASPEFADPRVSQRSLSIVYAGPLPAESEAEDWPFYRFQALLDALAAEPSLHFEVYNSFHIGAHLDPLFRAFQQRFVHGPDSYHARIPNADLVRAITNFDYGWMCLNSAETVADYPDTHTVISARVTGYISAGIPVIVDATWDAAVELIQRFNAGFVISEPKPESLVAALRRVDPQAHKAGALALRDHMLAQNERVIAELRHRVAKAGPARLAAR